MMQLIGNTDFLIGAGAGLIVIGALFFSRLFRNVVVGSGAAALVAYYGSHGAEGLLKVGRMIQADILHHHDFAQGLAAGAVAAALAVVFARHRRMA
jgi:glycogen synthase